MGSEKLCGNGIGNCAGCMEYDCGLICTLPIGHDGDHASVVKWSGEPNGITQWIESENNQ